MSAKYRQLRQLVVVILKISKYGPAFLPTSSKLLAHSQPPPTLTWSSNKQEESDAFIRDEIMTLDTVWSYCFPLPRCHDSNRSWLLPTHSLITPNTLYNCLQTPARLPSLSSASKTLGISPLTDWSHLEWENFYSWLSQISQEVSSEDWPSKLYVKGSFVISR